MNLQYYYWFFQAAIPPKICDDIIEYGKSQQEQIAVTGNHDPNNMNEKDIKDLSKKRKSNVVWMDDRWIYKEIQPYINIANRNAGWNFQWDDSESCQFTKYKLNQFYDWHCDEMGWTKGKRPNNRIRKISFTVMLNDDFEGGEFEIQTTEKNVVQLKKKDVIIFHADTPHRVKPVTKGVRHSLVGWTQGPAYK